MNRGKRATKLILIESATMKLGEQGDEGNLV